MKKIIICALMFLSVLQINPVTASNTYTQQQYLDKSYFMPKDKIVFDNEVNVTIYDINNQVIENGLHKELILPEYKQSYSSFKGWNSNFHSFKNDKLYKVSFKAIFETKLRVQETSKAYILSIDPKENPFQAGEYTCDWFRAGTGFGYSIGGPDAMKWTIAKDDLAHIDPHNSNLTHGIEIALAIRKNGTSTRIISTPVKLTLPEEKPTPPQPEEKPSEKPKPEEKPTPPESNAEPENKPTKPDSVKPEEKPTIPDLVKPDDEVNIPANQETKPSDLSDKLDSQQETKPTEVHNPTHNKEESKKPISSSEKQEQFIQEKDSYSHRYIGLFVIVFVGVCGYFYYRNKRK